MALELAGGRYLGAAVSWPGLVVVVRYIPKPKFSGGGDANRP